MSARIDPATATALYAHLDRSIDDRLGIAVGWTAQLAAVPYAMDEAAFAAQQARYGRIRRVQQQALDLFQASLEGEAAPEIAEMVLGDAPAGYGIEYHRALAEAHRRTPVFFRTDEAPGGQVTEIQCSGSGWGMVEQLRDLYRAHPMFQAPVRFPASLATQVAATMRAYVGREPVVHHLVDNASRPHGVRYFIQRLRDEGVAHLYHDRGVAPADCNFVRAHDFISLPTHNFFDDRMARCARGEVFFDLPPTALFDGKILMAWPFGRRTRDAFDDEARALFPHTSLIEADGVDLADGERVSIEQFCAMPRRTRTYYLKYAGTDIAINWGSKSVFLASTLSQPQCRELLDRIVADTRRGRRWILQQAIRQATPVVALGRDGRTVTCDAYTKLSGFYGPRGLMAILVMQLRSHKVHGSDETIVSIVR